MAAEGFFGRWSQRKLAERKASAQPQPAPGPPGGPAAAQVTTTPVDAEPAPVPEAGISGVAHQRAAAQGPPAPTLQDVAALNKDSDFTPFVARAVQPEVRNAALKKLFSDPHFNVMDGLDTYIDDYSLPDPLPAATLRQMASARFLKLFDEDDKGDRRSGGEGDADEMREDADGAAPIVVAQSPPASDENPGTKPHPEPGPTGTHDDDTDLRLQPDDAAGPARPGRGTE